MFLIGVAVGCIGIMRNRKLPARKSSGRINVFAILQTAAFFIMELQRFYGGNFVEKLYQSNDLFITVSPFHPICHADLFLIDIKHSIKNISVRTSVESLTLLVGGFF